MHFLPLWLKVLEALRVSPFPHSWVRGCPKRGNCGSPVEAPSHPSSPSLLRRRSPSFSPSALLAACTIAKRLFRNRQEGTSVWRKVCRLLLALQRGQRRAPSLQHRWSKRQQQTYHQVIIPTLRAPDILPSTLSLTKCEPRIKLVVTCSDADTDITRRKTADCEFPENLSTL